MHSTDDSQFTAIRYQRSARTDIRTWAVLAVAIVFIWVGVTVDPATNCSETGECAPWLIPVAKWIGIVFAAGAAVRLWINPSRGSVVDPMCGELVWWQNRTRGKAGEGGRIRLSDIGAVRILDDSDETRIELYDTGGRRQPSFDGEVVPWPFDRWAKRLTRAWPHIRIETRDRP